ncbi:hypothetical protein NM208_g8799 [Fusarium decemcellulare]|uniref:Uncharacterized protein n=1 Tax=Fusarium decemcellulare TaxID=57161 RepID=A0ACC1S403_9HYPO|nr:hypothetical protein NM208_g8799 [Fusarium decemcellulare]
MATLTQTQTSPLSVATKIKPKENGSTSNGSTLGPPNRSAARKPLAPEKHPVPFEVADCLIPESVGLGIVKKHYQEQTLTRYFTLYAVGLFAFYYLQSPALRVLGLGLVFPGAGFTAIGTFRSTLAFLLSVIMVPVSLVTWFGIGFALFPVLVYFGSTIGAAYAVGDAPVIDRAGIVWAIVLPLAIYWTKSTAAKNNAIGFSKRSQRNKYVVQAVKDNVENATPAPAPGSRELDLKTLRFMQHVIERGLSDDYGYFDIIDQFREAAIRYQLYGLVDALAIFQTHYAPNFHGYISEACRNSLEKSLTKKVMNYWKWESMLGAFKLNDWDPIKKDNIMVSGYLAVAMGLYQSSSGDRRYLEKDCLEFVIDDGKHYKTDYRGLLQALENNWRENPFCLYPCEPKWTYTLCNLIGMAGLVVGDRILDKNVGEKLKPRFERALEEEFTECDGRMLTLRNETTGLTIPNFAALLTDCINAINLTCYLPHIGHRNWAMMRKEYLGLDESGKVVRGPIYVYVAAAREFGDEAIRQSAIDQVDSEFFPAKTTSTGAMVNEGLSASSQAVLLMARLSRHLDLANATVKGPDPVAMLRSEDGKKLDLVLYPGNKPGNFSLDFERLQPGQTYSIGKGTMTADHTGKATAVVRVDGRTQLFIEAQ